MKILAPEKTRFTRLQPKPLVFPCFTSLEMAWPEILPIIQPQRKKKLVVFHSHCVEAPMSQTCTSIEY